MFWDLIVILAFVLALVALRTFARGSGARGLNGGDRAALERAEGQVGRLEERIAGLERVLDEDMPGWRRRVGG